MGWVPADDDDWDDYYPPGPPPYDWAIENVRVLYGPEEIVESPRNSHTQIERDFEHLRATPPRPLSGLMGDGFAPGVDLDDMDKFLAETARLLKSDIP